jgi:5-methylcytosine-specific restriction endonuclease McrA
MADTLLSFATVTVEDGCIIIGDGRKSPYYARLDRELAGGLGWSEAEWAEHLKHFGGKCLKCGASESIVADHVIPLYRGGKHDLSNIQPLCADCNFHKGLTIVDYRTQSITLDNA